MFMKLFLSVLTSEATKQLIAFAIKKLLESKDDGITREVIEVMIDGVVESKRNNVTEQDVRDVRKAIKEEE